MTGAGFTPARKSRATAPAFANPPGEDKVADFVTMSTQSHDDDPHPELPACFTKKKEVVELVQGIAGQGALADVVEPGDAEELRR